MLIVYEQVDIEKGKLDWFLVKLTIATDILVNLAIGQLVECWTFQKLFSLFIRRNRYSMVVCLVKLLILLDQWNRRSLYDYYYAIVV